MRSVDDKPKNAFFMYRAVDAILRRGLRLLPVSSWTESLALQWGYRFRPAPRIVRLRSGALMQVDSIDHLQLLLYYLGTFEAHCLPYLRSCAGKGATIVDVGANIGLHTVESSVAVGPTGRVISIEAAPANVLALGRNIELNGMKNVSVIPVAAGATSGWSTLSLSSEGNLGMYTLGTVSGGAKYNVEVRSIDDLLVERSIGAVDLIKMDIEGSEYQALLGAERTLRMSKPSILIEINEAALRRCTSSGRDVKSLLFGFGYRGWVVNRNGVSPILRDEAAQDCDECLFIHSDRRHLMDRLGLHADECE